MRRTRGFNPLVCGDLFFGYLFSALPDPSARWPPLRRGAGVSLLPLSVRSFGGIELLLLLFSEVADLARPPESPKARARQPPKMHPSGREAAAYPTARGAETSLMFGGLGCRPLRPPRLIRTKAMMGLVLHC